MRISQLLPALAVISLVAAGACQKMKVVPAPASFTVINALATANTIVPKLGSDTIGRYYSGGYGNTMIPVFYGSAQLYSPVAGTTSFSVVPSTDTAFNIFHGSLTFQSGDIYSFFLSGDSAHADTMLVKDNIPTYADSSTGIRFVNLSIGGKALVINLAGDSGNLQFPAIGYKQITGFKKYNANSTVGGAYTFEIRDQATGDLLMTYTWFYPLYNNNTIVLAGDATDPTLFLAFSVNNY